MVKYTTTIWSMERGSGIFRFQTNSNVIAKKLRRTKNWEPILTYCNKPIWIFQKKFNTPQDARRKLLSLCKVQKLKKGSDRGEFFAEFYANTTP